MDRKSSRKRAGDASAGRSLAKHSSVRYEIRASYEDDKRIYMVLDISADRTLDDLCRMILDAYDFDDSHSYLFNFRGQGYGEEERVFCSLPDVGRKSTDVKLGRLGLSLNQTFYFLYDFGAEWGFNLQIQKVYETEAYTIDGIVSVKGELEQYPGSSGDSGAEWDDWTDEYIDELEEDPGLFFFQIDNHLTVKKILDTRDEESLRTVAGRFLNPLNPSGAAEGTGLEWVKDQYTRTLLNDRKRLLLFLKGQAADLFFFMMTAIPEPEDNTLSWMDLMDVVPVRSENDVQEVSVSMMYLYAMGVCEPELDQEGQIQSFRICGQMRSAYEAWINQPEPLYDMYVYQDSEKLVNALMYRYGVIEIDRLWEISQARSAKRINKEDFIYLLAGRMEIFNRFNICVRDGIEYLSAYQTDDMEKILEARKSVPGLTYHPYGEPELKDMTEHHPYSDVAGFRKLVEALRNSFQAEEMLVVEFIVQTIAEQAMMETDPEEIIRETRTVLNRCGKRMTKRLQELIRQVAGNMPLATRYGYTRAELERMK